MAYNATGLKMLNPGGAIGTGEGSVKNVYAYATNDAAATVEGAGYFNDAAAFLVAGDLIMASLDVDGTPAHKTYIVASNDGTTVAVSPAATLAFTAKHALVVDIADLSADADYYVVAPVAGTVSKIHSVIDGAVSTADVTITPSIGGTPITGGAITITQSGSAAGDVDTATPSGANTVSAGQAIKLAVAGGGSGGSPRGHVTIEITP